MRPALVAGDDPAIRPRYRLARGRDRPGQPVLDDCEWDEMPDELRRVLLDRDGVVRLRVDPESGRSLRLPILRVLRRYGATLSEASDIYTRLIGGGVTGTPPEMRLLSGRLNTIGATTQLDP